MREELIALAERVEALSGPDREVDALVTAANSGRADAWVEQSPFNGNWCVHVPCNRNVKRLLEGVRVQPFTKSIDAAMSLAGDRFGSLMRGRFPNGKPGFVCMVSGHEAIAHTAPNAITAAALRALAEQQP